jgi:hypothetical protein
MGRLAVAGLAERERIPIACGSVLWIKVENAAKVLDRGREVAECQVDATSTLVGLGSVRTRGQSLFHEGERTNQISAIGKFVDCLPSVGSAEPDLASRDWFISSRGR